MNKQLNKEYKYMNEQYIIQQLNKAHKYMEDFTGNIDIIPYIADGIVQFDKIKFAVRICLFLRNHRVIDFYAPLESITSYANFLAMIKYVLEREFR